jgi:hypothetical protein
MGIFSSPNIREIKLRRMSWTGDVALEEEIKMNTKF